MFYVINGNYNIFVKNPQTILSFHLDNNFYEIFFYFIGGIIFSTVSYFLSKKNKPEKKEYVKPPELVGTLLGVTLISGILEQSYFTFLKQKSHGQILFLLVD